MTENVRVFVNAAGVDVPAGSSVLDAVRTWDATAADAVASGTRTITDSRGLPVDADAAVYNGAIFRLVSNRARGAEADAAEA